ncbi:L,D-transpeptidase family protein [Desulfatitalea alkaliphila]|uniref:L,D-transpeptidase family protein n=1 Tax=Desulfatitalea alkaliphila TaxID=2929485 RepID=A0AA41UJC5_9BACT|nr:L,D-transpeptidase family protein [Desulfatitalea alkaliphila]MCJ8501750.1 L,D-transpeptidase family protein [Desulfatitalea alkaliphila]
MDNGGKAAPAGGALRQRRWPLAALWGLLVLVGAGLAATSAGAQSEAPLAAVAGRLRDLIAQRDSAEGFHCRGELVCGIRWIPDFYAARDHVPVWLDDRGLGPAAYVLMRELRQAEADGLHPGDYHLDAVSGLLAALQRDQGTSLEAAPAAWADIDLLLTDAFLLLGAHLARGRVNPETLHADWVLSETAIDLLEMLQEGVSANRIHRFLDDIRPLHAGYRGLRVALQAMRDLALEGGWPLIPVGPTMRSGDQDARVLVLRHRLIIGGDLPAEAWPEAPEIFDEDLRAAVVRFQKRHGLVSDGLVGGNTLRALNVTVQERVRRIELNLERWRWLPNDLGDRYIVVNTADFNLRVVQDGQVTMRQRVVVGRPHRQTPVFSAPLTHVVFNPQWNVPHTIAVEDMLPRIQQDVTYLETQGIRIYRGWDADSPAIDPWEIDWHAYHAKRFPFRLVQAPGPMNALGRIQFMMPNKFAVFLHDTPGRGLFARSKRDFSSGCIRVEDAAALAHYLLMENPRWTYDAIQSILDAGQRRVVPLAFRIPVHLLYMTAWVEEDGTLQFRDDIYERDRVLDRALRQRLPMEGGQDHQLRTGPVSRWTKSERG